MTAVSQKIPNLIGGISQQPIEKQLPGTVKDALNVVPDVKGLLIKRPGSQLVGTLSANDTGIWHNYYRDQAEQYFLRVRPNGQVDVWNAGDGTPELVLYSPTPAKLYDEDFDKGIKQPDAKPINDTCNIDEYQSTLTALTASVEALEEVNEEIQEITVKLERDDDLTEAERTELETKKTTEEAKIPGLLATYTTAQAAFEAQAVNCGVYPNPYSATIKNTEDGTNSLDYFMHDAEDQLQMVTINDITFVTNRKVTARMGTGKSLEASVNEAFVVVDSVQYQKVYTLKIFDVLDDGEEKEEFKNATAIGLNRTTFLIQEGGEAAACPAVVETETVTDDTSGLSVRFDVVRRFTADNRGQGKNRNPNGQPARCELICTATLLTPDPKKNSGIGTTVTATILGVDWTATVTEERTLSNTKEYVITAGPYATSTSLDAQLILEELKADIESKVPSITVEIIGNGLYLTRPDDDFVTDTPDPQLLITINNEVNNVSLLPTQCKDGFVVKVSNTFEDEDDFYVKFVADLSVDSGAGIWEETIKPGILTGLDSTSMPHCIRRLADGTFEVSPVGWQEREVGDDLTNPIPSIIGQKINKTLFFRNRFVFLAGENVLMSSANQYWNLFGITAKTIVDSDPIDLLVASTYPSVLFDGIDTGPGLLLFATNQQFLVVAGSTEIFAPSTATAKSVGTYKYNTKVRPVHMGQSVGFLNDGGFRSRFFELVPERDANYSANETSKPVDNLIPNDINLIADSKDDNMLALAVKKGTTDVADETRFVWIYRYFDTARERVQSAWFKWKVQGELLYHAIMDDKYYAVTSVPTGNEDVPNIVTLQSFDLKIDRQSILIGLAPTMEQYDYQVHMDSFKMVTPTEMTYDSAKNETTWRLPIGYHGSDPIIAYELELNYPSLDGYITTGRTAELKATGAANGVFVTAPGNWKENPALCGYNFDMRVEMPTFFATKPTGENTFIADTTGYLTIHRAIIDFDVTGEVETTLMKKGQGDVMVGYESTIQDGYIADSTAVMRATQRTIPIYDKNVNIDIIVNSAHPTPTNITSVTWQGDYNPGNYRRV